MRAAHDAGLGALIPYRRVPPDRVDAPGGANPNALAALGTHAANRRPARSLSSTLEEK